MKKMFVSLMLPALLTGAGFFLPEQTRADDRPVTLIVSQVPVQDALKTLFAGAGIHNFVIAADVRGTVNLSLDGVPFSVALKQVLGAVDPPLAADIQDGVYHIRLRSAVPPALEDEPRSPAAPEDTGQSNFYKIGIKHYDAGVIADALTSPNGIVLLPPNFVIPANSSLPGPSTLPAVTTVGGPRNPGLTSAAGNAPNAVPPLGRNVLPPGVKRIFVLNSDNSLVVEASAQGFDNLTGSRLLSGGYTEVY